MIKPTFTIQDIKYSVDAAMFERAQKLFESGKVQNISETPHDYIATVQGTSPYQVSLARKHIDHGHCDCYMGQNDQLCKHMLALGLTALHLSGKTDEVRGGGYAKEKPELKTLLEKFTKEDTGFGFEKDLDELLQGQ